MKNLINDYGQDIKNNMMLNSKEENFKFRLNNYLLSKKERYIIRRGWLGYIITFFGVGSTLIIINPHKNTFENFMVIICMSGYVGAFGSIVGFFLPAILPIGISISILASPLAVLSYVTKEK